MKTIINIFRIVASVPFIILFFIVFFFCMLWVTLFGIILFLILGKDLLSSFHLIDNEEGIAAALKEDLEKTSIN